MQSTLPVQTHEKIAGSVQMPTIQHVKEQAQAPCCRICFCDMKQEQIHEYCQCKGSNGYIHELCLLEWIKKSKRHRDSFRTYYYICDVCRSRIFLETSAKCRCISIQQIKNQLFDKEICCTITTIIFLSLSFLVLGIILYISTMATGTSQTIIYAIGLSLTLLTIGITIFIYVYNHLIKVDVVTIGIQRKNHSSMFSGIKTVPIENLRVNNINDSHLPNLLEQTNNQLLN